jgi:hypothetical protein
VYAHHMNEADNTRIARPIERAAARPPQISRKVARIGGGFTAAYLFALALYGLISIDAFVAMKPDQFATFLSGVFAPLAFLWLVLGFFQQGEELRHSAEALWLQGEELRNSVAQQEQLVGVTREQLEFEREKITAQMEEARRRAQPDFTFTGGGFGNLGDSVLMNFRLLNRGPACADVRLYIGDGKLLKKPYMQTGSDAEFSVEVTAAHPMGDRPFKIEYTDALGNPGEDTLILETSYSGGRKILIIPD